MLLSRRSLDSKVQDRCFPFRFRSYSREESWQCHGVVGSSLSVGAYRSDGFLRSQSVKRTPRKVGFCRDFSVRGSGHSLSKGTLRPELGSWACLRIPNEIVVQKHHFDFSRLTSPCTKQCDHQNSQQISGSGSPWLFALQNSDWYFCFFLPLLLQDCDAKIALVIETHAPMWMQACGAQWVQLWWHLDGLLRDSYVQRC